jgi:hypothetical protein
MLSSPILLPSVASDLRVTIIVHSLHVNAGKASTVMTTVNRDEWLAPLSGRLTTEERRVPLSTVQEADKSLKLV